VAEGYSTFLNYVRNNDVYNVEKALRRGFSHVNLREPEFGDTPLIIACSHGHTQLARVLLQGGEGRGTPWADPAKQPLDRRLCHFGPLVSRPLRCLSPLDKPD
jgi:ankyrin repeat protein